MLKAKKLLYMFALGTLFVGGCCFPGIPLCNECVTSGLIALGTLIDAFKTT